MKEPIVTFTTINGSPVSIREMASFAKTKLPKPSDDS